ncbi:MAG: hypothetical protein E7050_08630 [Lentisphaerae bacterium]|nr:hypothetical protein [Lentisphaerota bacterium]
MILASLFQNGAVLQRGKDIPVWGCTSPDVEVIAVFNGCESRCRSSHSGDFLLYFPPMEAGGPFELTVSAPEAEKSITLKDILIGEVWLASGQSNMDYLLSTDWRGDISQAASETVGRKQEKLFKEMLFTGGKCRFFVLEQCASGVPERFCRGHWEELSVYNCGNLSAVGAWFTLGLFMHLEIPVGIIQATWGGTAAEVWMSYETLASLPEGASFAAGRRQDHWNGKLWCEKDYGLSPVISNEPENTAFASPDLDDSDWQNMDCGSWIKQKISGNGSIWLRKTVELPSAWENQELMLYGGSVDKHDITYFNGVEIGRTGKDFEVQFWNVSRSYRIAPELVRAGKCVVAMRASSFISDGAVNGSWYLVNRNSGEWLELSFPWRVKVESDLGIVKSAAGDKSWVPGEPVYPAILFDGMIRPLIPYAMRGVIWYQGESNAGDIQRATAYKDIMQGLIDGWRFHWGDPELKFFMVQLAGFRKKQNFEKDSAWAYLRESQRVIAAADPETFMVTAIDLGEEDDIHPQNKFDVGKRLAMSALRNVYGCAEAIPCGPEIVRGEVDGREVVLTFDHTDELKQISEENSFYLAGDDGEFFPAEKMEIAGDTVKISSSAVDAPAVVRYAWADNPYPVLSDASGIPAVPFQLVLSGKGEK